MNNDIRKIFRLAPDIYNENETMLEIYDRQRDSVDQYENLITRTFLNNFVESCDLNGIRRFEKIFGIIADEVNESFDFRKARIRNKFILQFAYTKIFLQQILEEIFGVDMYKLDIYENEYRVEANVETSIQNLVEQTFKDLREIIPANMIIEQLVATPYNHRFLRKHYTHADMQQFTQGELSQYV